MYKELWIDTYLAGIKANYGIDDFVISDEVDALEKSLKTVVWEVWDENKTSFSVLYDRVKLIYWDPWLILFFEKCVEKGICLDEIISKLWGAKESKIENIPPYFRRSGTKEMLSRATWWKPLSKKRQYTGNSVERDYGWKFLYKNLGAKI